MSSRWVIREFIFPVFPFLLHRTTIRILRAWVLGIPRGCHIAIGVGRSFGAHCDLGHLLYSRHIFSLLANGLPHLDLTLD
jgi:hypothetical protein